MTVILSVFVFCLPILFNAVRERDVWLHWQGYIAIGSSIIVSFDLTLFNTFYTVHTSKCRHLLNSDYYWICKDSWCLVGFQELLAPFKVLVLFCFCELQHKLWSIVLISILLTHHTETRCMKVNLSVRLEGLLETDYACVSGCQRSVEEGHTRRTQLVHCKSQSPPMPLYFELPGVSPLQECCPYNEGQGSKFFCAWRPGSPRHTQSLTRSLYLNPASGYASQRASSN